MFDYTPDYTPAQVQNLKGCPEGTTGADCDRRTQLYQPKTRKIQGGVQIAIATLTNGQHTFSAQVEITCLSDQYSIKESVIRKNEHKIWGQNLKTMDVYGYQLSTEII